MKTCNFSKESKELKKKFDAYRKELEKQMERGFFNYREYLLLLARYAEQIINEEDED